MSFYISELVGNLASGFVQRLPVLAISTGVAILVGNCLRQQHHQRNVAREREDQANAAFLANMRIIKLTNQPLEVANEGQRQPQAQQRPGPAKAAPASDRIDQPASDPRATAEIEGIMENILNNDLIKNSPYPLQDSQEKLNHDLETLAILLGRPLSSERGEIYNLRYNIGDKANALRKILKLPPRNGQAAAAAPAPKTFLLGGASAAAAAAPAPKTFLLGGASAAAAAAPAPKTFLLGGASAAAAAAAAPAPKTFLLGGASAAAAAAAPAREMQRAPAAQQFDPFLLIVLNSDQEPKEALAVIRTYTRRQGVDVSDEGIHLLWAGNPSFQERSGLLFDIIHADDRALTGLNRMQARDSFVLDVSMQITHLLYDEAQEPGEGAGGAAAAGPAR